MSRTRLRLEGLDVLRCTILRETEQALLYGLEHPETLERIPVVEVGRGTFSPSFAAQFWTKTLGTDVHELARA